VGKAEELNFALEAAERSLGRVVERYRLALGCCALCGDFFELGSLAVVAADAANRVCFEHEECPPDPTNYREAYRNPQQGDSSGLSPV